MSVNILEGALGSCTVINLRSNNIGDVGMQAFRDEIRSGVLDKLKRLWIGEPLQSLRYTCSARNIKLNTWA
jgi:hypothetical protein